MPAPNGQMFCMNWVDDGVQELTVARWTANIFRWTGVGPGDAQGQQVLLIDGQDGHEQVAR